MVLIKSLKSDNSIQIPEEFVFINNKYDDQGNLIRYINIEIGINWEHHAKSCKDCGALFEYLYSGMDKDDWIIEYNKDEIYHILPNNFSAATAEKYMDNKSITYNFVFSELQLMSNKISIYDINEYEKKEKYEICNILILNHK
jgi:hypothetical protein